MRAANGRRRGEQAALLQLEEQQQRQRREAQRGDAGESHRVCFLCGARFCMHTRELLSCDMLPCLILEALSLPLSRNSG